MKDNMKTKLLIIMLLASVCVGAELPDNIRLMLDKARIEQEQIKLKYDKLILQLCIAELKKAKDEATKEKIKDIMLTAGHDFATDPDPKPPEPKQAAQVVKSNAFILTKDEQDLINGVQTAIKNGVFDSKMREDLRLVYMRLTNEDKDTWTPSELVNRLEQVKAIATKTKYVMWINGYDDRSVPDAIKSGHRIVVAGYLTGGDTVADCLQRYAIVMKLKLAGFENVPAAFHADLRPALFKKYNDPMDQTSLARLVNALAAQYGRNSEAAWLVAWAKEFK